MKLVLPALLLTALILPATPASASILTARTGTSIAAQFTLDGGALGAFAAPAPVIDVATGDVNADGTDDLLFLTGQTVVVRDGRSGRVLRTLSVAAGRGIGATGVDAGDVTGDGRADIVVSGGSVRVYDGQTGSLVRSFFAYDPAYTGNVAVSVGDLEGDHRAEIATAAGTHVKVFAPDGSTLRSFFAYAPSLGASIDVATGDVDGDGHADLVTVPGAGAGAYVRAYAGTTLIRSFLAADPSSLIGATVAVADGRIVIATGSTIRVFDGATLATRAFFMPFGGASQNIAIAA